MITGVSGNGKVIGLTLSAWPLEAEAESQSEVWEEIDIGAEPHDGVAPGAGELDGGVGCGVSSLGGGVGGVMCSNEASCK